MKRSTVIIFFVLCSQVVFGQQLIYRPVNPAFGGDTFNYQWLMSSAQAQNKLEDGAADRFSTNPLDDFEGSLNRQILNQLSRGLISNIFGEDGASLQEGTFEFGNLQIEITYETEGVNVSIVNNSDGSQTSILVPYY
jgi:curli production assembly/transport component CsgF